MDYTSNFPSLVFFPFFLRTTCTVTVKFFYFYFFSLYFVTFSLGSDYDYVLRFLLFPIHLYFKLDFKLRFRWTVPLFL